MSFYQNPGLNNRNSVELNTAPRLRLEVFTVILLKPGYRCSPVQCWSGILNFHTLNPQ